MGGGGPYSVYHLPGRFRPGYGCNKYSINGNASSPTITKGGRGQGSGNAILLASNALPNEALE